MCDRNTLTLSERVRYHTVTLSNWWCVPAAICRFGPSLSHTHHHRCHLPSPAKAAITSRHASRHMRLINHSVVNQINWHCIGCMLVLLHPSQGSEAGVPQRPGFGLESESLIWRTLRLRALSVSFGLLWNYVAVYLTIVLFILQLKLCWYTSVQLLLEEFTNFSQVILKHTIIISQNKS